MIFPVPLRSRTRATAVFRRPVLTAVVVAVAAGITALLAGPAVGAGAGVLASTASLLLTADALGPPAD